MLKKLKFSVILILDFYYHFVFFDARKNGEEEGSQSPEIPSDEPLHQKLHQEFENGNKRTDHDDLRLQEQSLF